MSYLDRPKIPKKPDIIPSPQEKNISFRESREQPDHEFDALPVKFSYTADECYIEEIDQANLVNDLQKLQDDVRRSTTCTKQRCQENLQSKDNQVSGERRIASSLERQLAEVNMDLESIRNENLMYRSHITELNFQLKTAQEEAESLSDTLQAEGEYRAKYEKLSAEFRLSQKDMVKNEELVGQIERLQSQLHDTTQHLEVETTSRSTMREQESYIHQLEERNKGLEDQVRNLSKDLDIARNSLDMERDEQQALSDQQMVEVSLKNQEIAELRSQNEQYMERCEKQKRNLSKAQKNNDNLEQALRAFDAEKDTKEFLFKENERLRHDLASEKVKSSRGDSSPRMPMMKIHNDYQQQIIELQDKLEKEKATKYALQDQLNYNDKNSVDYQVFKTRIELLEDRLRKAESKSRKPSRNASRLSNGMSFGADIENAPFLKPAISEKYVKRDDNDWKNRMVGAKSDRQPECKGCKRRNIL